MARAYGLASRVCYLGVDTELWSSTGRSPERLVVGIGEFGAHKAVDFVVEALGAIASPRPELHWIGNRGDPGYIADLVDQAKRLKVEFTPHIALPQAELLAVLRRASLLAYAPRLEPFGYAPLECAAAGIPTVGVAEGGLRETIQDGVTGILVERDVNSMAAAVSKLIADPSLATALGAAAQRSVRANWSLDDAVGRLEDELSRTVQRVSQRTE